MNDVIKIPVSKSQLDLINKGTGENHVFNDSSHGWTKTVIRSGVFVGTHVLVSDYHTLLIRTSRSRASIAVIAHELLKQYNLVYDNDNIVGYESLFYIQAMDNEVAVLGKDGDTFGSMEVDILVEHGELLLSSDVIFVPKRHRR